jgi:hypothetical protein
LISTSTSATTTVHIFSVHPLTSLSRTTTDENTYNLGRFDWSGADFAGSAENISFSLEGAANQPILRAALRDGEGNLNNTDLNLEEWLNNNDGQFAWNS